MKKAETASRSKTLITFKPLAESDLDLLTSWIEKPYVEDWWSDDLVGDGIKNKYLQRIADKVVHSFMVYINGVPVGFIQYYYADKVGDHWWPDEPQGTIGVDHFIGEESYLGRGFGSKIIRKFIQDVLVSLDVKKIITDVNPRNRRAIMAYQKAGFNFVKTVTTPEGIANLMVMIINKNNA